MVELFGWLVGYSTRPYRQTEVDDEGAVRPFQGVVVFVVVLSLEK